MNLTAEELQENYIKFLAIIEQHIASPRKELLLSLYEDHAERIMLMPASSVDHYHNAFPGGYVDHVMRVCECALKVKDSWESMGAVINFTDEELIFAAFNHDLGKIGTEEHEMYIPNDSEWHRKNQGKMYKNNPANEFMTVPDRSLFLLQQRGIKVSVNEYLAMKLHDGLYDEGNRPYYISHSKEAKLRTSMPLILHHADHMASRIEYERWEASQKGETKPKQSAPNRGKKIIPQNLSETEKDDLINIFKNF